MTKVSSYEGYQNGELPSWRADCEEFCETVRDRYDVSRLTSVGKLDEVREHKERHCHLVPSDIRTCTEHKLLAAYMGGDGRLGDALKFSRDWSMHET